MTLLVECKKNNPHFVSWIFFPSSKPGHIVGRGFENKRISDGTWEPCGYLNRFTTTARIADEARETRGNYLSYSGNDKTKTSNTAVSDAAFQVALATHALLHFETELSKRMGERKLRDYGNHDFVPMIVTSAKLRICEFDPKDVQPTTGEIQLSKASLKECKYLFYDYPLPPHLQMAPTDLVRAAKEGSLDCAHRMHILVANAESLGEILTRLAAWHEARLDRFSVLRGRLGTHFFALRDTKGTGVLVGTAEHQVGGVEMQPVQGQVGRRNDRDSTQVP